MYREMICAHCRMEPGRSQCEICGTWICGTCALKACEQKGETWTGECRICHIPYPAEQRQEVLNRGDGEVVCEHCGSTFRLRQLHLMETDLQVKLIGEGPIRCDGCERLLGDKEADTLFVLHDRWQNRCSGQIYHLLCACGQTLASTSRRDEATVEDPTISSAPPSFTAPKGPIKRLLHMIARTKDRS